MSPSFDLPRAWWSVALRDLRPADGFATYTRFDPASLPPVPAEAFTGTAWLEGLRRRDWSITDTDDQQPARSFDQAGLAGLGVTEPLPDLFHAVVADPTLLAGIRSYTACYLDLGDVAVPVADAGGGVLVHFLSDQQWARHWLLHVDADGDESVVTSEEPIGFRSAADDPTPMAPLRLAGSDVEICSPSFGEFLYRFWLENELSWRLGSGPLAEPFESYARHYRDRGGDPPPPDPAR